MKANPSALEPLDVRLLRRLLNGWPFTRGKGTIMRLARPFLDRRDFVMQIEPGIVAVPDLDDRILHWCFVDGSGSWDPIMHLSRAIIRPGDTLLDVGANVGLWVMGAARRAGGSARVVALSPSRTTCAAFAVTLPSMACRVLSASNWRSPTDLAPRASSPRLTATAVWGRLQLMTAPITLSMCG